MFLDLLAVAAIPSTIGTVTGTGEAIHSENQEKREAALTTECNLVSFCETEPELHGKQIVLRDEKVFLETASAASGLPFSGFYVSYPVEPKHMGLVSMISHDPPAMGWIYANKDTLELKYGNKTASCQHIYGPWDFTEDEVGVVLEGEELFVAVEEAKGVWALYYDRQGDEQPALPSGKRVVEISVERKPKPK
ncbi:MAG: hypothetical protein M4579_002109 [Chaenotheca gracillima]|nr:MAG: hypothetical protein M4579_002109 [Chaenotheca gracillima]